MAKILAKSDSHDGLRDKLQTAITAKHGDGSRYSYMGNASVHDVFPEQVVHTIATKPGLFASKYNQDDSGAVSLGDPKKVEPAYKPLAEAIQGFLGEATEITEAAYDKTSGTLRVTVIKPGFNTSKSRFYPKSTLKRDHGIFKGAKMFANHATVAEERARPEGDVRNWVASLTECSVSGDGSIVGVAKVHDAPFKEKLSGLQDAGLLHEMGISIRAAGMQQEAEMDGVKTMFVESFTRAKSVDFVTFPGAGGRVEMMESEKDDIDFITVERLTALRPDIVKHFTEAAEEAANVAKTVEQLELEVTESNRQRDEALAAVGVANKATVASKLTVMLKESGLPQKAQDRIAGQFKEADKLDGIAEAITAEKTYIVELGVVAKPTKGKVTNMGESAAAAAVDGDPKERRIQLVRQWKATGMTEAQAETAADNIINGD